MRGTFLASVQTISADEHEGSKKGMMHAMDDLNKKINYMDTIHLRDTTSED